MWTAVVVTCVNSTHTEIVQKELNILVRKKVINEKAVVLAIEDPADSFGSGSATLNALLLTAEYLSAKANYQVVTADVLENAFILIYHNGRPYPFDICGKGFITLSQDVCSFRKPEFPEHSKGLVTNIEYLINFVTKLSGGSTSPPGVWVCSADMVLNGTVDALDWMKNPSCDVALFCTREKAEYAKRHGLVKIDGNNNIITDIIYHASDDDIQNTLDQFGKVPVVAGIVFLSFSVVEALLSLHALSPVDSCTYMGLDSGAPPLQASLYFDILLPMAKNVIQDDFIRGKHSATYNIKHGYNQCDEINKARQFLWQELHKFKMKALVLENIQHFYWTDSEPLGNHMTILQNIKSNNVIHSFLEHTKMSSGNLAINSMLKNVKFDNETGGAVVQHCLLDGTEASCLSIGKFCFLSGIEFNCKAGAMQIENHIGLIKIVLTENRENNQSKIVFIILGIHDYLNKSYETADSTFCNISWKKFFERTGISYDDLWPSDLPRENKCLLTARLYPVVDSSSACTELLWLQSQETVNEKIVNKWRSSHRISIKDVLNNISSGNMELRRKVYADIVSAKIDSIIRHSHERSFLNYFNCSVIEGWENKLLVSLDKTARNFDGEYWDPAKAARTLACIADLLSCMAGKEGGLRSGPASNISWKHAFQILDSGINGSISEGVDALCAERGNWLKGHPSRLMRAARHYEGAVQILIRHAVLTVKKFITIHKSTMPPIGQWISVECPARIDLQGGWSDTPPICYELGGSVVNIALLINNKRPIGARVKRIVEPVIKFKLGFGDETSTLSINEISDLKNYQHLINTGALLKVCIISTEIIDIHSLTSLQEQLLVKYGSGLEVHTWSHLPQGSGLGTSSIMAAAILAALWLATGQTCDRSSLIHAVLLVEQMLTSGGGWQDQVGGIMGGINRGYSLAKLPLHVCVDPLQVPSCVINRLNEHLLLIYTGKVRLAKNLLQNVIRNWYARDATIVQAFQNLIKYSKQCAEAIRIGNLQEIGNLLNIYWKQKMIIAPGCNPLLIQNLMAILHPHALGQTLVGAGGGGFLILLTKEPNMHSKIKNLITTSKLGSKVEIYPASIDVCGITAYDGNATITLV